jgi:hypothetical protein
MRPLLYRRALRQPAILALNGLVVLLIGFDICHHLEIRRLDPHHLLTVSCKMRAMIRLPPGHVERLQMGDEGLDVPLDLFLGLAF